MREEGVWAMKGESGCSLRHGKAKMSGGCNEG